MRLGQQEHILLVTVHHIVTDGWSAIVLFKELAALYQGLSAGQPTSLPKLTIQYADYAVWQRAWLRDEAMEGQMRYWRKQLAGAPDLLQLPSDRPRTAAKSFRGASQFRLLPHDLLQSLNEMSRRESVTIYMTLLAAFQTLLFRYTGEDDVAVGSPIANRTPSETEGLIGFFVNTLVMRTDLSGNPTFRELLQRVKEVALGAYAHQDVPFEKLVDDLQPRRDLSRNPLFQVMFSPYDSPVQTLELASLTLRTLAVESVTTKFDLTLFVVELEGGLQCQFEYNSDLFESHTIARMLRHFHALLAGIVVSPESRLVALPLLTEAEGEEIVSGWNATRREYEEACIHELFEEQVERSPDAVAVVFEDQSLSFLKLNARANQLARVLRRRGVLPDDRVGLLFERSVEMFVALLGILKAGGAYVPLNPNQPSARLMRQLDEAGASVLIMQETVLSKLEDYAGSKICLDRDRALLELEETSNLEPIAGPHHLAYVIYTSGSTGVPKGVAITHQNLVNYTEFICERLQLEHERGRQVSFATTTTIAADLGNTCIFPSLISGGCLHVLSHETSTDTARFARYVADRPIDVLKIVPSHLSSLLASPYGGSVLPHKYLITGGETLSWDLVKRVRRLNSDCEIINHYGPTETTVGCLTFKVGRGDDHSRFSASVPIGRPIANTEVYILDQQLRVVPIGVSGELYIGGAGVARGYLNSAEQTSDRFVPNPFSLESDARLYRTGDRARYLTDGNIEFLGRVDKQIKIRGYRIEPAEIEAVLLENASVKQAVVIAREDRPGDKTLVAYVVAVEESGSVDELRRFLLERLPDYMVPAAFVFLDELPLTPNGKLDREALPAPSQTRRGPGEVPAKPRTPDEEVVARIWADLLNLDQVDINDNFFFLGGHSLLITQVISRVRESLAVELPVRTMFESPTVAAFCEAITQARSISTGLVEPPIGRLSRDSYRVKTPATKEIVSEP